MRAAIEDSIPGAEVLIHVEPETSFHDPTTEGPVSIRLRRREQVDGGRRADGGDGHRVAGVVADREQDGRDRADRYDDVPGGSGD